MRVDIDAEQLGRRPGADIGLHGDAVATLTALAARSARRAATRPRGPRRCADVRGRIAGRTAPTAFLASRCATCVPDDGILAADSTQPAYAATTTSRPHSRARGLHLPIGFGCLGCALPMAIGAKLAAPDRPVAALAGDGGFMFTVQELATAPDLGIALPILATTNTGYGEIRDSMDRVNVPHVGVGSTAHDFVKLAEGFGCAGVRVDSLAAMQEAFTRRCDGRRADADRGLPRARR